MTENSKDTPNRKNAFESIAEMDLEPYCKNGWSDRIGLEKVSQSKKDDFTGINSCRKWPCEYGRTCKFLHIPTGKRIKQIKPNTKNYNIHRSGVGTCRKEPDPLSCTKERGPGEEEGRRRSQDQGEERQKLEEGKQRIRKQTKTKIAKTKIAETVRGKRLFPRENTTEEEEGQQVRERLGRRLPKGGKESLRQQSGQTSTKVRESQTRSRQQMTRQEDAMKDIAFTTFNLKTRITEFKVDMEKEWTPYSMGKQGKRVTKRF